MIAATDSEATALTGFDISKPARKWPGTFGLPISRYLPSEGCADSVSGPSMKAAAESNHILPRP